MVVKRVKRGCEESKRGCVESKRVEKRVNVVV